MQSFDSRRASRIIFLFFFLVGTFPLIAGPFDATKDLPVAFQGRFRSLEPAAQLWLYDLSHLQQLKQEHLPLLHTEDISALELLWKVHFLGHSFMDNAPLFWIHYADVKQALGLDLAQSRFSYQELTHTLFEDKESNLRLMRILLPYEYAKIYHSPANRSRNNKQELRHLAPGLWVSWRENRLFVTAAPQMPPWNFLSIDMPLTIDNVDLENIEKQNKIISEEFLKLFTHIHAYRELSPASSKTFFKDTDLESLQREAGSTLKMLPSKLLAGEWISLHALNLETTQQEPMSIGNFTAFSDEDFHHLRLSYNQLKENAINYYHAAPEKDIGFIRLSLEQAVHEFSSTYEKAYASIMGIPYREAINKELLYPSFWQLHMETWYYRLPLIEMSLFAYSLTLILFLIGTMAKRKTLFHWGLVSLSIGLIIHTLLLALRCFVLQRPPVSNMFETVIYVPWVAMLLGLGLFAVLRHYIVLIAATIASASLLILLKLTDVDARMENVQAVLDSQYWLIVHVLMIVASYGVFIVCGVLAHFYLVLCALQRQAAPPAQLMAQCLLQTMYIGVALLIPGTILGGVWAAESWGRFWDWDPKESWAFISACIYVLIIHAYTFKKIQDYGLAVGSIGGLMAISFTWYGVNYILGTGLHSYGFGKGGEYYYYGYLLFESLFLVVVHSVILHLKKKRHRYIQ